MSTPREHSHVCRDCGDDFDCDGALSADGQCATFDGLCMFCAADVDRFNGEHTAEETESLYPAWMEAEPTGSY